MACLAAILIMIGLKLASPKMFKAMWKAGKYQFIPFIFTVIAVVLTDLLKGVGIGLAVSIVAGLRAAEPTTFQSYEYATIRWAGRENTHLIRSNGEVEFLGPILTKIPRPDRAGERAFYMNIAMNAVAKQGFEFAGISNDEIVMKRSVAR